MAILEEFDALTGDGKYLFPSFRSRWRAMSENSINGALRRLGYSQGQMTAHGFRAMAATLLNEMGTWSATRLNANSRIRKLASVAPMLVVSAGMNGSR